MNNENSSTEQTKEPLSAPSELNAGLGIVSIDASYIHEPEVGAHPTVTVRFAIDDWKSRDALVRYLRQMHNGGNQPGRTRQR